MKTNFEPVIDGLILGLILILLWWIYAYYYKTSITRLCKLASKKYMETLPFEINDQYLVTCDPALSKYNSSDKIFTAVITMVPDMNHPEARPRNNVTKMYRVIANDDDDCLTNTIVCAERNKEKCFDDSAKKIVVQEATCININ